MEPHAEKKYKGGEDALSMTRNLLAVADGVGGWANSGIDPARYSRKLCDLIEKRAVEADDRLLMNPREILVDAVRDNQEVGSSTAVVLTLDKEAPIVYTANLGDSGYMQLRLSEEDPNVMNCIFRSKEQ